MFYALKKVISIAVFLVHLSLHAQDFEWVKFYQGSGVQQPVSLSVDKAGNQYATFNFYTEILLDTSTISGSSNNRCLVIKQNTEGKTLWHRVIESPGTNVNCLKSMFNSKGNQLVFVYASNHLIVGSDTVKKTGSGSRVFMLEFNDTGALVQSQILIEGSLAVVLIERNKLAIDKDDNLYLALPYTGSVKVIDSTGTTSLSGTSARNIIFKFSATGRKFEWVKEFPFGTAKFLFNSLKVDIHQNVYIACIWMGHNSFTFNGTSISNTGSSSARGAVFILNKNGGDKSWFFVESSHKKSSILDIAVHDSTSVFISGNYNCQNGIGQYFCGTITGRYVPLNDLLSGLSIHT